MAHIRHPMPHSGLGFQEKVFEKIEVVPASLESSGKI